MLVYRVFLHDAGAADGEPGHATYLHRPQKGGRWDNDHVYGGWYLGRSAEGAIGEIFGRYPKWSASMFDHVGTGLRRAIGVFSVPDDLSVFDFDDTTRLQQLSMRPSQVVIRNSGFTQGKAHEVFAERRADGSRRWAGVSWWSYYHASWTNLMLFQAPGEGTPVTFREVQELDLTHPAVVESAQTLERTLP